eukprot:TRINITY_DN21783_c0_g1_i1.p1 TRINITY_DN21783_c0_g1~~TRINITY_DN21783_c0_g1_i1.p1  ORF type:complete len:715 (+),score=87.83 TRINITY_DN21783_c0_g1_i1:334-2478(+)
MSASSRGLNGTQKHELLNRVAAVLKEHYKHFDPTIYEQVRKLAYLRENEAFVTQLVQIDSTDKKLQAKADLLQSLIYKTTGISVLSTSGKAAAKGTKSKAGNRTNSAPPWRQGKAEGKGAGKGKSEPKQPALVTLEVDTDSLLANLERRDGASEIPEMIEFDDIGHKDGITISPSRKKLIEFLEQRGSTNKFNAIVTECEPSELFLGNNEALHLKYNVHRVVLGTKNAEGVQTQRMAWLINVGLTEFVPAEQLIPAPDSIMVELSVRFKKSIVPDAFYDSLRQSPVKLAAKAVAEIAGPDLASRMEPLTVAMCVPDKVGEEPADLVQAYIRVQKKDIQAWFELSMEGGIVLSAANSVRDQALGFSILPIHKLELENTTWKHVVGESYAGIVPLTKGWDKFGVRFLSKKDGIANDAAVAAEIAKVTGAATADIVINAKYCIKNVPKTWAKPDIIKWLNTSIGWTATFTENQPFKNVRSDCATYVIGAVEQPRKNILSYDAKALPIVIEPFDPKRKTPSDHNKVASWTTRVLAAKHNATSSMLVADARGPQQMEEDDRTEDDEENVMKDTGTVADRLTRLAQEYPAKKPKVPKSTPAYTPSETAGFPPPRPVATTAVEASIQEFIRAELAHRFEARDADYDLRIHNVESSLETQTEQLSQLKKAQSDDTRRVTLELGTIRQTQNEILRLLRAKKKTRDDDESSSQSTAAKVARRGD